MLSFYHLFANRYELYLTIFQTYFFWNGWKFAVCKRGYINTYYRVMFELILPKVSQHLIDYYLSWNRISVISFFFGYYLFCTEFLNFFIEPFRRPLLFFKKKEDGAFRNEFRRIIYKKVINEKTKIFTEKGDVKYYKVSTALKFVLNLILRLLLLDFLMYTFFYNFVKVLRYKIFPGLWFWFKTKTVTSKKFLYKDFLLWQNIDVHLMYYSLLVYNFLITTGSFLKKKTKKFYMNNNKIKYSFFFNDKVDFIIIYKIIKKYEYSEISKNIIFFILPFFNFLKKCLIAILVGILFIIFAFYCFKLPFLRTTAGWLLVLLFGLWLFSGFNHFLKRYKFGKYTTAMQRFWKRAYMCFWMIEGFLFIIFFYYTLIASAEPRFFFDIMSYFVPHCIKPTKFLLNCFLIVILIIVSSILLISIKFKTLRQIVPYLTLITLILFYILLQESYQFYYLLNFYNDAFWVMDEESYGWELEYEIPRARNRLHYTTLIIIAKFWHYIFIFLSWVFFVMKSLEQKRIRYAFFAMNIQNFIIFYIMNWVCMHAWLKWVFRRFMDQQYYWFFSSFRVTTLNNIISDVSNLIFNFIIFFFKKLLKFNLKTNYLFEFYFYHPLQNLSSIGVGLSIV